MKSEDKPSIAKCFRCKQGFAYGPHAYDGRSIPEWKVMACNRCIKANWDGLVPNSGLVDVLEANGANIERNDRGLIDWPWVAAARRRD
jgi:hypothetical protein